MELADLDRVVVLDRLSFSLPWPESSFKYEIENNSVSRCWVMEVEESPNNRVLAGMIVIWLIVDEAHVATFAVHPDYRRRRLAQRLLIFTLLDAYHSGATRSFLEVRRGNLAARNLYKRFGYEEVGVRKHYYKDNGEDAIMMNLEKIDPDYLESLE
jgi:ribosomal-protein-alanine N-acetyltransferase